MLNVFRPKEKDWVDPDKKTKEEKRLRKEQLKKEEELEKLEGEEGNG